MAHSLNPQNHIWLRSETPIWIANNLKYVFEPELIPSVQDVEDGNTPLEEYEYEDLLFMSLLGYYFSEITPPPSPVLSSFGFAFKDRVRSSQRLLDAGASENKYPLCPHIIGVDLVEDFTDTNAVVIEATRRSERIAEIFSSSRKHHVHEELIQTLNDEEYVDIFLYSRLAESFRNTSEPMIPRPARTIELIRQRIQHVDDLWNVNQDSNNTASQADVTFIRYTTCVLFDPKTQEPKHLVQLTPSGRQIRRNNSWADLALDEQWSDLWTWRTIVSSHVDLVVRGFDFDPNNFQAPQTVLLPETSQYNPNPSGLIPFINSEIVFKDQNGVLCCTALFGEKKQIWNDLGEAIGLELIEAWVLRFDELGRDTNRPETSSYQEQFSMLALDNYTVIECHVRDRDSTDLFPALLIPISTDKDAERAEGDLSIAASLIGQQGVYRLRGDIQEVVWGTNVNFVGSRRFNISFA